MIDSQSAKSTEAGCPRGYDAGKKVKGRKRHAMVDTEGRALVLQAHPASVQDRDGAVPLLAASRRGFPFVEHAFADSAYAGERVAAATRITVEIVRKHPEQVGFTVHQRRWASASSPGSAATAVSRRTSRAPSPRPKASSTPSPSCSLSDASHAPDEFRVGLCRFEVVSAAGWFEKVSTAGTRAKPFDGFRVIQKD